ncbi:MAG: membrane dipeptidase [Acidobacteriia bacterium]|nr:membrane dipeptidase [Terriglobia bacterium]
MRILRWVLLVVIIGLIAARMIVPGMVEDSHNKVLRPGPYRASPQAEALHKKLLVADLHADSLLWDRNLLKRSTHGHVDIPRLGEANVALQAFTIVTTAPKKLNIVRNSDDTDQIRNIALAQTWPPRTWNSPKQRAIYQAEKLEKFAASSGGKLVVIKSRADLQNFLATRHPGQVAGFLGAEGAQPLEGDLANLDDLYAAGIRMMAPTHFTDTAVGGAAAGMKKSGLTDFGRRWVKEMESRKMIIDLAHASHATLADVTAMATRPLLISHTGVKGTCDNNRNLTDDELRAIARSGGVIGIGLWETATCGTDARATARAMAYAAKIVGVERVALGSDNDGGTTQPFDVTGLVLVTEALMSEGFSEHDIQLIMGGNVARLLLQTLPD